MAPDFVLGQAPTPSPSTTSDTRPARRRSFDPSRTFKMQQTNDRQSARDAIRKRINGLRAIDRWARMTVEDRTRLVLREYKRKIAERGNHPTQGSAKTWFPERHNEKVERQWILERFRNDIVEEDEDDEDDEEVPPSRETMVKTEDSEDDEADGEDGGRSSGSESGSEGESETGSEDGSNSEEEAQSEDESADHELACRKHGAEEPRARIRIKRPMPVEEEDKVKKAVVYTVVSRGMVVDTGSGAKRVRTLGWPWFKVAGA